MLRELVWFWPRLLAELLDLVVRRPWTQHLSHRMDRRIGL